MVGSTHHLLHHNCSNHFLHVTPFFSFFLFFFLLIATNSRQRQLLYSQVFELHHIRVTLDLHGLHFLPLCHQQKVLDLINLFCFDLLHHGSLWPTPTKCSNHLCPFPISRNLSHVCNFLHLLSSNAIFTF